MNTLVQIFENTVANYNLVEGQDRGLKLDYNIFSSTTDTFIYDLEITNLSTQEKVSLVIFCWRTTQKPKFLKLLNC